MPEGKSEKPSDEIIAKEWRLAARCYRGGSNLGQRIALRIADDLEASGVTENDIDRIFSTPTILHRGTLNHE